MAFKKEPAESYYIRSSDAFSWAYVFVKTGKRTENEEWITVSVVSDFGNFGYAWTHVGASGKRFLTEISFEYAMEKFLGERFRVFDKDKTVQALREHVIDRRRNGTWKKSDARELWDLVSEAQSCSFEHEFFRGIEEGSDYFWRDSLYEMRRTSPCPQAVGFWKFIWPEFVRALKAEEAVPA